MFPVEIKEVAPHRLAAMVHKGAYNELSRTYQKVAEVFTGQNLWPQAQGMIG